MIEKDSPRVKEILKKTAGNPRKRLALIYDICKSKTVCDGGDELQPVAEVLFLGRLESYFSGFNDGVLFLLVITSH